MTGADESAALSISVGDGVARITLDRPARRNALDGGAWTLLGRTLEEAAADPSVRVLVLAGAGKAFCAGADLSSVATGEAADRSHLRFMRDVGRVVRTLHELPIPTVARVHGPAMGAGCNLALACDLVIASHDATFSEIFSRRGLAIDTGGSWLLPRLVGLQRAKELTFLAPMLSAARAAELGLVTTLVAPGDLDDATDEVIGALATGPTVAHSLSKSMLNNSFQVTFDQALEAEARAQALAVTSLDGREGLAAFLERRDPQFQGR